MKTNSRPDTFLRVMSILTIIVGAIELVAGLLVALAGGFIAAAGASADAPLPVAVGIALIVLGLIGGCLLLAVGISALRGRHLKFCFIVAIIIACLCLVALITDMIAEGAFGMTTVSNVISVVFSLLLAYAIRRNM